MKKRWWILCSQHLAGLTLGLSVSHASALDLKSVRVVDLDSIVESETSTLELHSYSINEGDSTIGEIHTIAGDPRLVGLKSVTQHPIEVSLLRYDAGTAGTSVFMQMDRVAVLTRAKGQKNWKLIGDHAIALKRYQGVRPVLELERMWKWNAKALKIRFESFDEDPAVEYIWNEKDKSFIRKIL